jgi:DNA polymerase IV
VEELPIKKIIHVDMDAFYASVEQLDNPELRGKPVAVGGDGERGVVAAASYEARKFKVRSALSSKVARYRCPDLIFVKPRFERYKQVSEQIREVFYEYTDLVEPLSLDEAFLDVTENKFNNPSASLIAKEIRDKIKERTGLNASAGISINKFTAKVASDINKPNGQKTIPPEEVLGFLELLPIEKFFGVGKVTAIKMNRLGIFNGFQLKACSEDYLSTNFGKSGRHLYQIVRGIQNAEVKPNRKRKSIAAERTFETNLTSEIFMLERLEKIAEQLEKRLDKAKAKGKTATLKIKYSDFTQQTRSKTLEAFVNKQAQFFPVIKELLYQEELKTSVRLLGISITNLEDKQATKSISVQLKLDF